MTSHPKIASADLPVGGTTNKVSLLCEAGVRAALRRPEPTDGNAMALQLFLSSARGWRIILRLRIITMGDFLRALEDLCLFGPLGCGAVCRFGEFEISFSESFYSASCSFVFVSFIY